MPPLPPAYDSSASNVVAAIQRRMHDIRDMQIPRLRGCSQSLVVQQQYHAELQADLDTVTRLAEELDDLSEDQKGPRAKKELHAVADAFRADIARLRKDARAALLASKRAIDAAAASNRAELLRSSAMREKPATSDGKITEDALMKANADVTDAMRRTLTLMQGELERSVLSTQMLEASTATLRSTTEQHDVLTDLLGTSKQLITALEKTDWMDRLLILAALAFFVLVVLFILKQRIVDRGIRIAFFWTRFLPGAWKADSSDMSGVASSVTAAATSLATAVTASALSAATSVAGLSSTLLPEPEMLPTADVHARKDKYEDSEERAADPEPGLVSHDEL
ncbi:Sec20-domain-containing protein [Vararia minispora EC-137]|uniref:Sec20-domain-containing protein n=1 Tax=Vararia minispora EC-137 TaxID=1314806 RepID=A0ACB8QUB5_9AGAM|nr:Sec20-domain-containing protein [Vararia minispora EC-137]